MGNSGEGVSKEVYLEMCEMMGTDPDPEHMPVEYGDFPTEIQVGINTYSLLQDRWEPMSGTYLGKDLTNLETLLRLLEVPVEDYITILQTVRLLDSTRTEIYQAKAKARESVKKPA